VFAGTGVLAQEETGKTGNIDIRSTMVGARVYMGDTYVGDADLFLEQVPAGEHMFIMRQGSQRISGNFHLKEGETLMLEGRFEERRIVDLKEVAKEEAAKRADAERKAEAERKVEAERRKREDLAKLEADKKKKTTPKKQQPAEAPKPQKSADEERRGTYLNIIRVDIDDAGPTDIKVGLTANPKAVSNLTDSKSTTGKLYRNKQHILLCEEGSCERDWMGRFFLTDEAGRRDAFLLKWRETVFTGVTPAGTSKKELDWCLNGECKRLTFSPARDTVVQSAMERYVLSWGKKAFTIRRADIMKEIVAAGGTVPEY
jgi:hypothetical protein